MKTRLLKQLAGAAAAVCAVSILSMPGITATLMEEKMNLERSIQERSERLVEKIIGSREMVVFVNVELEQEAAKSGERRDNFVGMQMTEEEYLPGITYSYIPIGGNGASKGGASIKRINVLVILDTAVGDAMTEKIRKELHELLGLDPLRNDLVTVKKITFGKPAASWKDFLGQQYVKPIYLLLSLIIVAMIVFVALRIFFSSLEKTQFKLNTDARIKNLDQGSGQGGDKR